LRDWLFLGLALWVALLLQITSMAFLLPSEIKPDLVLGIVVWAGRQKAFRKGMVFSFLAGVAVDLMSVNPTGLYAVFYLLVFLVMNNLVGLLSLEGTAMTSVFVLMAAWVCAVYTLLFQALQGPLPFGVESLKVLTIKSFLTALFSLPLFYALDLFDPKPDKFLEQI
jgi:rod shape-determining protein MreD